MVNKGFIEIGQKVDLCIPTGNFGSILSAIYAKSMDVPYDRVICASNDNKILHDFLETGIYGVVVHQIKQQILKLRILIFSTKLSGVFFSISWKLLFCFIKMNSYIFLTLKQRSDLSKFCENNSGFADSGLVFSSDELVQRSQKETPYENHISCNWYSCLI